MSPATKSPGRSKRLLVIVTAVAFAAAGITLAQTDPRPARPTGTTVIRKTVTRPRDSSRRAPAFPKLFGIGTRAMKYERIAATVEDDIVTVEGTALINETDPTFLYIWSTRIYDAPRGGKLLKERHYTDAAISGLGEMVATCRHDVILAPGQYRIELSLYCVPAGWDWSRVERGADLKMLVEAKLSGSRRVTIEE
jgi:hypothetical protein